MYFYLDKISNTTNPEKRYIRAIKINSDFAFDPYRYDTKFKAFLRMYYLPVQEDSE